MVDKMDFVSYPLEDITSLGLDGFGASEPDLLHPVAGDQWCAPLRRHCVPNIPLCSFDAMESSMFGSDGMEWPTEQHVGPARMHWGWWEGGGAHAQCRRVAPCQRGSGN